MDMYEAILRIGMVCLMGGLVAVTVYGLIGLYLLILKAIGKVTGRD